MAKFQGSHGLLVVADVVSSIHQAHAGQPKVCQFDVPIAGDEQVVGLQIPVDDSLHRVTRVSVSTQHKRAPC